MKKKYETSHSHLMLQQLKIFVLFGFFLFSGFVAKSSKLEKGYEALRIYNYFQARKLFYEIQNKKPNAYSSFGLAVIFSRHDNPFHNIDSAGKYIKLSFHTYIAAVQSQTLSGFVIDSTAILKLADTISQKMYRNISGLNSINAYEFFLQNYYLANSKLIKEVVYARDEFEFNHVHETNNSDSTKQFMVLHPQSPFYREAFLLLESQLYNENTFIGTAEAYISFLKMYPNNNMVKTAHEKLFSIYRQQKDSAGLAFFVKNYPSAYQTIEAWKLLFSLSVKAFSFDELKSFVNKYPNFPLKTSILHELELNKIILYPYQLNDFVGFIDTKGKFVIKPKYDAASDFYEGLSVVSKDDSVFFINKQNVNPFSKIYSEAAVFKNGIAPVKQNNKWVFINRQGQTISRFYDEINELSDNVYVVKTDSKYGALDHFGQNIIEPKFDKLGDFKNGYAYFMDKGLYGFISKSGTVHRAEFEWISDFSAAQIAIVKQQNKYGLINVFGKKILEPLYDQILRTDTNVFIVILNNQYGFFTSAGCFLTPIAYDYTIENTPQYYTNGSLFKLIKKDEQSFVDANGRTYINFGAYQEINFPVNGLLRVKLKNKYGYVDRKLTNVIPYKFSQAQDFSDSLALVKLKENNAIITIKGVEVFFTGAEIVKISSHYFSVNDDARSIINQRGDLIYTEVDNVQKINNLLIVTLNTGEIKLIYD
ncbi:WG repeat-containing protein [Aurantibacillus circumpalustris]|uniref:WG repeat-containing protein n=1 Tax=Aurantibacillus circumpalustris TaxID=3036359 RepID=UPI00295B6850|nr:WG repeat-containing protein [Aurantibacillus circumpalustris]